MFPHSNWQSNWQLPGKKKLSIPTALSTGNYPRNRQGTGKTRLHDHLPRGPGWISELNQAVQSVQGIAAELLELGAQAAPPQRPQTPLGISHLFHRRRFFPTPSSFLASKRTCWETLKSKSFSGFAGAGDECAGFLAVEIVCTNFFFCETEQNLLPFHPKAAGAGKHSQHEQAQCSFTIPVCMDGFMNFTPISYQENSDLTLLNWIFKNHLPTLPESCLLHNTSVGFMHNKKQKSSPFYVLLYINFFSL